MITVHVPVRHFFCSLNAISFAGCICLDQMEFSSVLVLQLAPHLADACSVVQVLDPKLR